MAKASLSPPAPGSLDEFANCSLKQWKNTSGSNFNLQVAYCGEVKLFARRWCPGDAGAWSHQARLIQGQGNVQLV